MNRILTCDCLLKYNETKPFLKRLITGDEKWITYDKNVQYHGQKGNVWWDWMGIIHYELLPPGETINSDLYCLQLMRLKQEVEKKRPELVNRQSEIFYLLLKTDNVSLQKTRPAPSDAPLLPEKPATYLLTSRHICGWERFDISNSNADVKLVAFAALTSHRQMHSIGTAPRPRPAALLSCVRMDGFQTAPSHVPRR
ncbi:Mariner Mos1 transposase [Eumeta japonica]|uniref:Mariner Mos1 transposase n=1 Tax=Eumeta variegata TaxID=151549 RepID=A0A4C1VTN7_EUMVA|nr:Mariner Mos1 transposase [Eumeta japonica]